MLCIYTLLSKIYLLLSHVSFNLSYDRKFSDNILINYNVHLLITFLVASKLNYIHFISLQFPIKRIFNYEYSKISELEIFV